MHKGGRRFLMAALLVLAHAPNPASADPGENAREAMRAGNYAEAYCIWRPLAERGDPEAQFAVGWMYHNGYGLAIDDHAAIDWWEKAAGSDHTEAMMALAMLYRLGGKDVKRNSERAVEYFLRAAELQDEDAREMLLTMIRGRDRQARALALEVLRKKPGILGKLLMVAVPRANLRSGPSTKHGLSGSLKQGAVVVELERQGDWVRIGVAEKGLIAWVFGKLVVDIAGGTLPPGID